MDGVKLLMSLLELLKFVGWVNKDAVSFIVVKMDPDVGCGDCLHSGLGAITEHVGQVNGQVFFRDVEVGQSGEHHGVVVLLLGELVLKTNDLEALSADLAAVYGALSHHVKNFFVRVRIILDTGSHADNNTPARV
jgi:hypothetical protein